MSVFRTTALIFTTFLSGTAASAQDLSPCSYKPEDPANCVRFVGCVNNGEAHFFGTARGWDKGPLFGMTSSGATCAGEWSYDERLNRGKGRMTCSDGNKAGFSFFSRDGKVQTHTGVTISDKGDRMSMWTGANLIEYFSVKYPDQPQAGFECGPKWVPFPEPFLDEPAD